MYGITTTVHTVMYKLINLYRRKYILDALRTVCNIAHFVHTEQVTHWRVTLLTNNAVIIRQCKSDKRNQTIGVK